MIRRFVLEIEYTIDGDPLPDAALLGIIQGELITESSVLNMGTNSVVLLDSVSIEPLGATGATR